MSDWTPSDAQIEAACDKEWELVRKWPLADDERFVFMNKPNMREVLIAAHAAAPPVDTTEFEAAVDTYRGCRELANRSALDALMDVAEKLALGEDVTVRHDGTVKYWRDEATAARQRLRDLFEKANTR